MQTLLADAFYVIMLGFALHLVYTMIRDQFDHRRWKQARQLCVKIGDLMIDRKIDPVEGAHLMNMLGDPSPAALAMARERIAEITEPLMLQ